MQKLFRLGLVAFIAFSFSACLENQESSSKNKNTTPVLKAEKEQVCQDSCAAVDKAVCDHLYEELEKCSSSFKEANCKGFVSVFSKALSKTIDCKNTCNSDPYKISMTQACDELNKSYQTERAARVLSQLKFKSGRDLFLSEEFRSILDGALAEDILPEIEKTKIHKK